MPVKVQLRADTGHYEQDHHYPRIYDVLKHIIVLYIQVGDLPDDANDAFGVVHVKDMVEDDDHNCRPTYVVQVILSHIKPTFAIIVNIIVAAVQRDVYQQN